MSANEESLAGSEIDNVIGRVETLYRAVTGQVPPPDGPHGAMPVEKDPGQHVQEQLDRLLGMLGDTIGRENAGPVPWNPPITAAETDSELIVRVDLPGVAREDVEVVVNGDEVTIRGRRREDHPADARLRLQETRQGPFARRLLVPPTLRAKDPNAQLKDGVLEIRFPRRSPEELAPKTVDVQ